MKKPLPKTEQDDVIELFDRRIEFHPSTNPADYVLRRMAQDDRQYWDYLPPDRDRWLADQQERRRAKGEISDFTPSQLATRFLSKSFCLASIATGNYRRSREAFDRKSKTRSSPIESEGTRHERRSLHLYPEIQGTLRANEKRRNDLSRCGVKYTQQESNL